MFNFEEFLLTKSHAIFSIGSRQDIVLVISQIDRANIEIIIIVGNANVRSWTKISPAAILN